MNNTVTFKVAGNDLLSYFDRLQQRANRLTVDLLNNSKKETTAAKEQLKLIEDQIRLMDRKQRTAAQISSVTGQNNYQNRISNLDSRGDTLDAIFNARKQRFGVIDDGSNWGKATKGSQREWEAQGKRLQSLNERNTESGIQSEFKEFIKKQQEIERESKIANKLVHEQIDTIRQAAREQVNAVKNGDMKLEEAIADSDDPLIQAINNLTKALLEDEKEKKDKKKGASGRDVLSAFLGADAIKGLIGNFTALPGTQNGFDLIKPAASGAGKIIGGIIGGIIGSIVEPGGGTIAGAAIGSQFGDLLGSGLGEFEQRRALAIQDYFGSRNKYLATTGGSSNDLAPQSMVDYGLSSKDYLQLLRRTAIAAGGSGGSVNMGSFMGFPVMGSRNEKYTNDAWFAEKGYGIDQSTSMDVIDMQRSGADKNKDLGGLIGGILAESRYVTKDNRAFLNEFLGKFVTFQKELLRTQETVHSGTTNDILNRFNEVGGQFDAKDPRAMGLYSQVNNALINPATDNLKVLSMYALRRNNPKMGFYDLLQEQQRGLASPKYLQAMIGMVMQKGGNEQMQMANFADAVGLGGNLAAARRLWNHKDAFLRSGISQKDIDQAIDLSGEAAGKTTPLEKTTANIQDGLLQAWNVTLDTMASSFKTAMEQTLSGAVIEMQNGRMTIGKQKANKPTDPNAYRSMGGYDMRTQQGRSDAMAAGDYGSKQ